MTEVKKMGFDDPNPYPAGGCSHAWWRDGFRSKLTDQPHDGMDSHAITKWNEGRQAQRSRLEEELRGATRYFGGGDGQVESE